ncbi:hypothetical protein [Rhodococcus sp. WAY2]|uniref:hypothetical protein n=1 Tax=Rhodococcus sp. WAY2 TaxID=2663121 RepID=UPI0013202943|nr:hypothetical protein [Rhodococcus sp. WAY2]QHE72407.1 zinc-containing alcohol dehydrogenase / quinone oxidoreductase (NADPH:quinone reductase) [Rhodococcus sp. WAY2]
MLGNVLAGPVVRVESGVRQLAKHLCASVATTTSTTHAEWAKRLSAETVIDHKKDGFTEILHDYDLVPLTLGGETLGLFE